MTLIWTEGFEVDGTSKMTPSGSNVQTWAAIGGVARTGIGSAGGGSLYKVNIGSTDQDDLLIVGIAGNASLAHPSAEKSLIRFTNIADGVDHVDITWGTDGKIRAYRGILGSTPTLLGTTTNAVMATANTYYYLEVKVRLSDTIGTVEIRVDETSVLSLSGQDTKNGGTSGLLDQVSFNQDTPFTAGYDDIYICNEQGSYNTDFLGAVHIEARVPNGNGNSSQGVGSDGNSTNNYQLVDEALGSSIGTWATDYVDLANTNDEDTYAFTDPGVFPSGNSVKGVMVWIYVDKTDAGARGASVVARHASTESTVALAALTNGTFKILGGVFEQRPEGGDWTVSDVDGSEFGVKAV